MQTLSSLNLGRLDAARRAARFRLAGMDPWAATNLTPTCEVQREAVAEESREVLLCGGKGSGKTLGGALRSLQLLSRESRMQAMALRQAYPDLAGTTGETMAWVLWRLVDPEIEAAACPFDSLRSLPKDLAVWREKPQAHLRFPNGSRQYFRHLADSEGIGGYNRGFLWLDEALEVEEATYKELRARIRQPGVTQQLYLTTNPPRVPDHWLERHFGSGKPAGKLYELGMTSNPYLSPEFVASFDDLVESERRNIVDGKLGTVFGVGPRVFPEFRRTVHAAPARLEPFPGRVIVRGWDITAVGRKLAAIALSVGPGVRLRILREWEATAKGIGDFGWEVLADCYQLWGRDWEWEDGLDPAAFTMSFTDERSAAQALAEVGVLGTGGAVSRTARRELIGGLLSRMVEGEPAVQIDPSCRRLLAAFDGGYTHDDIKGGYSDIVDALGYGLSVAIAAPTERRSSLRRVWASYAFGARRQGPTRAWLPVHDYGRASPSAHDYGRGGVR